MPVDQLVELEQALLPEQLVLAVAELRQELKLVWHRSCCFRNRCFHNPCCSILFRSNLFRSSRQQSRIHKLGEPVLLRGGPIGRSQPVSRSELKQRRGCSSIGSDEPGHRFRQQLRGERVRPSHSDRRRMHS